MRCCVWDLLFASFAFQLIVVTILLDARRVLLLCLSPAGADLLRSLGFWSTMKFPVSPTHIFFIFKPAAQLLVYTRLVGVGALCCRVQAYCLAAWRFFHHCFLYAWILFLFF